jgi:ElaB/YqjD/DUF883 family membrane-anchored ribosome-binding protein
MPNRVFVRDLDLIVDLDTAISKFNYGAREVIQRAAREIRARQEEIDSRRQYWLAEHRRREARFEACISDEDQNCSAERAAVTEAEDALGRLRSLSLKVEQAIDEYQSCASRLQDVLDTTVGKAKADLSRITNKYQSYLASQGTSVGSANVHGYQYQKARHQYILNCLKDDPALSNLPRFIRAHLQSEFERTNGKYYMRSPAGYHVGHKIPRWNHPSNFRWELAGMNSWRGGKFGR